MAFQLGFGNSIRLRPAIIPLFLMAVVAFAQVTATSAPHNHDFWHAIVQHRYAVPEGQSAFSLAKELSAFLGSPNPELRDDLAYSILDAWIRNHALSPQELLTLADEWRANLRDRIGEIGTDSVLKRSFSALCLSSLAERDAKSSILDDARYHRLLDDALAYLRAERDLRGYDPQRGWIHATAHTADLLQALVSEPRLTHDEQLRVLSALSDRLATAPQVYTQGEQDRIAQALATIIHRPDLDVASLNRWLASVADADAKVWTVPLTPESLARYQNHTYTLQALAVRLSLNPLPQEKSAVRDKILEMLRSR